MVLLGPPGAGKGTQAQKLAERLSLAHVASGDLFRQHQTRGTELGWQAQAYMERGELVPDQVTIQMVLERVQEPDCALGYILDGFPAPSSRLVPWTRHFKSGARPSIWPCTFGWNQRSWCGG